MDGQPRCRCEIEKETDADVGSGKECPKPKRRASGRQRTRFAKWLRKERIEAELKEPSKRRAIITAQIKMLEAERDALPFDLGQQKASFVSIIEKHLAEHQGRGRTEAQPIGARTTDAARRALSRAQLRKAEAEQKLALAKEVAAKASEETCRCAANLAVLEAAIAAPSAMDDSGEDNPRVELLEPCL